MSVPEGVDDAENKEIRDKIESHRLELMTNQKNIENLNLVLKSYSEKSGKIIARTASLVMRLVKGEEANEEVFRALTRAYDLLSLKSEKLDYKVIELLSVARILIALGYLSRDTEQGEPLFTDVAYQHRLIRDINQALAESQL